MRRAASGRRKGHTHISFSWWSVWASCRRLSSCCWASRSSRDVRSSSRASSWLVSLSLVFSALVSCLSLCRAVHWPSSWKGGRRCAGGSDGGPAPSGCLSWPRLASSTWRAAALATAPHHPPASVSFILPLNSHTYTHTSEGRKELPEHSCLSPVSMGLLSRLGSTFLVMQSLSIHVPMQETWARSLVREDSTCQGTTKLQLLSPRSRSRELQLLSLCPRACAPQEKPSQ